MRRRLLLALVPAVAVLLAAGGSVGNSAEPAATPEAVTTPTNAASWLAEGKRLRAANELQKSAEALTKAIELDPQSWEAHKERGDVNQFLERYDQAIADYDRAIEIDPTEPRPYNNRALVHEKAGRLDAALADLDRAIELDPKSILFYRNRARCRQAGNRGKEAVADLQQVVDLTRKSLGEEHLEYAQGLYNLGNLYLKLEDYPLAQSSFSTALSVYQVAAGERSAAYAACLNDLGLAFDKQRAFAQAEVLYRQALEIRREVLGTRHPDYAWSLNNLAWVCYVQGDYTDPEPLYLEALEVWAATVGEDHPNYAWSLKNISDLYRARFDQLYAKVVDENGTLDFAAPEFSTLEAGAEALTEQREWAAAEAARRDLVERTSAVYGKQDYRTIDARTMLAHVQQLAALSPQQLDQLGQVVSYGYENVLGREHGHEEARALAQSAVDVYERVLGREHFEYAESVHTLAHLYQLQGDLAQAEPLHVKALQLRQSIYGKEHPAYARSLNYLGLLYDDLGKYPRAQLAHWRALDIMGRTVGPLHPHFATCLHNVARFYRITGNFEQAIPLFQKALHLKEITGGKQVADYASSLNSLGYLQLSRGAFVEAEPLFQEAVEIWRGIYGETHPDYILGLCNLAQLMLELDRAAEGVPLSMQVVQTARRHLADAATSQSEREQLKMASSVAWHVDVLLSLTQASAVSGADLYPAVFDLKGQVFVRQRAVRQMRQTALQSPDSAAARTFAILSDRARELDGFAKQIPDPAVAAEHRQRLEQLTLEIERLQQVLSGLSAEFRRSQQVAALTPNDLAAKLPIDSTLIDLREYDQLLRHDEEHPAGRWERQYVAFITRLDAPPEVVWLGPAGPINAAVAAWREHLGTGLSSDAGPLIRQLVWEKLEPRLEGVATILVSPDGAFNQLPWGALPGKEPGSYLIEKYAFVTVPVPVLLPEIMQRPIDPAAQPSLLAIGDVNYGADPGLMQLAAADRSATAARSGEGIERWLPLGETRVEVAAIEDTFRRSFRRAASVSLREAEATEQGIRDEAPLATVVHVATHGFFAPASLTSVLAQSQESERATSLFQRQDVSGWHPGLLSGIVLAGANNEPQPDHDDGVLTALEVAELDLSNTELVTLSACETGLGKTAGGEGVLGLQRAFQLAGARTTVTSLWKVRDDATRSLMVRFYENLWKHKLTRIEALRQAQLTVMRDSSLRGAEPVGEGEDQQRLRPKYWAAFVLSGDWR